MEEEKKSEFGSYRKYKIKTIRVDPGKVKLQKTSDNWYNLLKFKRAKIECSLTLDKKYHDFSVLLDFTRGAFITIMAENCPLGPEKLLSDLESYLIELSNEEVYFIPSHSDESKRIVIAPLNIHPQKVLGWFHKLKEIDLIPLATMKL